MTKLRIVSTLLATTALFMFSACDYDRSDNLNADNDNNDVTHSAYSVWVTKTEISGVDLSDRLKEDTAYADTLCQQDTNKPTGYQTHFALISTPELDRVDLIEKHQLNSNFPVEFAQTGELLTDNLGSFLAQKARILVNNTAANDLVKLTFSKDGHFEGYCDGHGDYTNVINTTKTGEMTTYSASCTYPHAVLVCMSLN